jgi:hypothetical protein
LRGGGLALADKHHCHGIKKAPIIHDSVDYNYLVTAARIKAFIIRNSENIASTSFVNKDKNVRDLK